MSRLAARGPITEKSLAPRSRPWLRGGVPAWLLASPQSVTGLASTDVLTAASFPYPVGTKVRFSGLVGGAGLANDTDYWVRDVAGLTFKVAATQGGAAVNFTTDVTAGTVRLA